MRRLFALCLSLCMVTSVWAGDTAYTIRSADLKAKPYGDAETLATLPPRTRVEVVKRQSSWTQVKSGTSSGWVKMLSLQLEVGTANKRADNGLSALFNVAATGRGSSTVTTGVRGLSEEQLKNTKPNPQALQDAKKYASNRDDAQRFATDGKLHARSFGYLSGGK